ncbi:hypothetical protein DICPUDRAFT_92949 [Dictyostelium purpureum]|uniref:BZIP domain-containing protein n=1 Tax=Dictyostelium purpureum TaxID=5786 RepID=F0ZZP4_DICPU|nr:uncharacterized protein DICPUDRAFT_92949 [Dictyostelium purpureum]EGC30580.1 hypothetical protein DICPUDRAFT_92949 [Dictyostelium purpureum]|eukprot:XP_003292888.1 hypothetical protein DICPUDRAFT_92949 [Dictyostelium purpureum]
MDFMNNDQMKQNHYNIVPESVFDVPFGISSQPMLNMQQQQQNNQKMNFKQPIQPNQTLIPIPPNNLNNPQVSILQNQIPQHNINNNTNNNQNTTTTNNNNNNNNNKKKEEDKSIKKRKFISSTPVKGENGTTLIPTTDGSFNMDEERHMKRQRRLVKNREAAQLFRQRQKAYIQDLEKKVSDLTGTNSEFRARVELLNSENKLIREQLLYLRNFVTQAVSFSFPKGAPGSNSPTGAADQFLNSILPPGD